MRVVDLKNNATNYDAFLVDALGISKTKKATSKEELKQIAEKPTTWQKDILLTALDKIEGSLPVSSKNEPLDMNSAPPLENYKEALAELKSLVSSNFKEYASLAQSNITPQDILYLFEDENNTII